MSTFAVPRPENLPITEAAPRRALWLLDALRLGGAERLALELALEPPSGWKVELIALQGCGSSLEQRAQEQLGARLRILGMRHLGDVREWRRLERTIQRRRPALIHAHLRYASIWAAVVARRNQIPLIITQHVLPGRRDWRTRVERGALERAQLQLYVSEAQRHAWQPARLERTEVVPNGVTSSPAWPEERRRAWRTAHGFTDDPVLLTVGVIRREKGWREWVAAAERLRPFHPRLQWVWLGDGPDAARFTATAGASPVRAALHLMGARHDVADWMRAADLFVFPSRGEALPTVVLEAMAHGLPVVATDLPATREILHGCGTLVAAGSGEALARGIETWLEDPGAARAAASRARERWRVRYSQEEWRMRLAQQYERVAPARPSRLMAIEFYGRGGLYHYSRQLAQGLAAAGKRNWEVTLVTGQQREDSGSGTGPVIPGPAIVSALSTWNPHARPRYLPRRLVRAGRGLLYVRAWMQVVRQVGRLHPDIVLLGDLEHRCDAWFVGWLRRRARLACIWHNPEGFERHRAGVVIRHQRWRDRLVREFDEIFVHGQALAGQVQSRAGVRPRVIAHGNQDWIAAQAGPDPDLNRRFSLPSGAVVGLLFGTLSPYKGVEVLVEALAAIPPETRPMLLVAGMPTPAAMPENWKATARRLGVERWLRWDLRYVPTAEITWYFRRADFVVLPYRAASQSGVAHLGMTFGKPLIVSDVGALAEIIEGNGLVVPARETMPLARAMTRMTQNGDLRRDLGRKSEELATTRHDWRQIASGMLAVFNA